MWLIPPSFPCVGTRWHWKTGAGVGKTGISHFLMFVSFSGESLQHKWYPVIYSAGRGKERKESQELQKLYGITQLFVESMEEIGTVRDKVTEHDIKWLGLTAKSLCSWGKWNFPSLTCSCCFTEESLPAFIRSLPVSTALLECISSPKLDSIKTNSHSISLCSGSTLGPMEETQQWCSGQNRSSQRALNKNHSKWSPEGALGREEGIGTWLRLSNISSLTRVFHVLQKGF